MDYTLEQKAVALLTNTLWWRFEGSLDGGAWTRIGDDIVRPGLDHVNDSAAEYHIGDEPPKPPRVLSELEQELLAALQQCVSAINLLPRAIQSQFEHMAVISANAAIAKAKGEE